MLAWSSDFIQMLRECVSFSLNYPFYVSGNRRLDPARRVTGPRVHQLAVADIDDSGRGGPDTKALVVKDIAADAGSVTHRPRSHCPKSAAWTSSTSTCMPPMRGPGLDGVLTAA